MSLPPGTPIAGEHTLRWLDPSKLVAFNKMLQHLKRTTALVTAACWVALAVMAALVNLAMPGTGVLLGLLAVVPSVVVGIGVAIWRRPRSIRWWVTTRRLLVRVGNEMHEMPIRSITKLEADASSDEISVTTSAGTQTFGPVQALSELWGAVGFARAWDAPDFEVNEGSGDTTSIWWAVVADGLTTTRGVMAIRPHAITWLPEQVTRTGGRIAADLGALMVGARVHRIAPVPPLERFSYLLQHASDPAVLDTQLIRAAQGWGGWSRNPASVDWRIEGEGEGVSVVVDHDGSTYTAQRVPREVAESMARSWQAALAKSA
jgi:hypothetical protein